MRSGAAGTEYFATPCIIRLRRTKMLVLSNCVCSDQDDSAEPKRTVALSQDTEGRDPVEGAAKVFVKGCESLNNKERNRKAFFHYGLFIIK